MLRLHGPPGSDTHGVLGATVHNTMLACTSPLPTYGMVRIIGLGGVGRDLVAEQTDTNKGRELPAQKRRRTFCQNESM
jgi:hypothetical protein